MAVLPIIKIGHPTLRKVAKPVVNFNEDLKQFAGDLIETMRLNEGVGLAATQVDMKKSIFVIDKSLINEEWEAQAFVNPEILKSDGEETIEEGCLSIPGIRADVNRALKISVRYQNLAGETVQEELEGLLARVFQHEYDHLNGILFIDRIPMLTRKLLEPQIREIQGAYP